MLFSVCTVLLSTLHCRSDGYGLAFLRSVPVFHWTVSLWWTTTVHIVLCALYSRGRNGKNSRYELANRPTFRGVLRLMVEGKSQMWGVELIKGNVELDDVLPDRRVVMIQHHTLVNRCLVRGHTRNDSILDNTGQRRVRERARSN